KLLITDSLAIAKDEYHGLNRTGILKIIEFRTNRYPLLPRYASFLKRKRSANRGFSSSKSIDASFEANQRSCLYQNALTMSGRDPVCGSAKQNVPPAFSMRWISTRQSTTFGCR